MSLKDLEKLFYGEEKKKRRKPVPPSMQKKLWIKSKGKCMWCRKQPPQEIHHIDENPSNNKLDNLIALCGTCHNKVTYGEITKEQLRKRLGIKKKTKKVAKKRRTRRRRPKTQLERLAKQLKKDF